MTVSAYIPKIVYGSGPTTLSFTYPPAIDNGEESQPDVQTSIALAGDLQVVANHVEIFRYIKFSHLTGSQFAALQTFYQTWAALGNSFDYYQSQEINSKQTYTLDPNNLDFKPTRLTFKGADNDFLYAVELYMRRAI